MFNIIQHGMTAGQTVDLFIMNKDRYFTGPVYNSLVLYYLLNEYFNFNNRVRKKSLDATLKYICKIKS